MASTIAGATARRFSDRGMVPNINPRIPEAEKSAKRGRKPFFEYRDIQGAVQHH